VNNDDDNVAVAATTPPAPPSSRVEAVRTGGREGPPPVPRIPLGAELPVFCERCGYSLNALPQVRCDHCTLLQFHCPECGHHQPINTLRPALQRTLGRLRAFVVGAIAFIKLNWFGWHLFFWVLMGHEWAYSYDWRTQSSGPLQPTFETVLAFSIYCTVIGFFSRLMLLRWRSGALVGVVLGAVYCVALVLGFHWRIADNQRYGTFGGNTNPSDVVMTGGRTAMTAVTFAVILLASIAAWPVWVGFVRVVMPERAGSALLEWQRSLSDPLDRARLSDRA
jgi:hypothetical protein